MRLSAPTVHRQRPEQHEILDQTLPRPHVERVFESIESPTRGRHGKVVSEKSPRSPTVQNFRLGGSQYIHEHPQRMMVYEVDENQELPDQRDGGILEGQHHYRHARRHDPQRSILIPIGTHEHPAQTAYRPVIIRHDDGLQASAPDRERDLHQLTKVIPRTQAQQDAAILNSENRLPVFPVSSYPSQVFLSPFESRSHTIPSRVASQQVSQNQNRVVDCSRITSDHQYEAMAPYVSLPDNGSEPKYYVPLHSKGIEKVESGASQHVSRQAPRFDQVSQLSRPSFDSTSGVLAQREDNPRAPYYLILDESSQVTKSAGRRAYVPLESTSSKVRWPVEPILLQQSASAKTASQAPYPESQGVESRGMAAKLPRENVPPGLYTMPNRLSRGRIQDHEERCACDRRFDCSETNANSCLGQLALRVL